MPWYPVTGMTRLLKPGTTYQFQVRGRDGFGNASIWRAAVPILPLAVQENGPGVVFTGTWARQVRTGTAAAYGGYVTRSTAAGATATLTFTGRSVALVAPRSPALGNIQVCLDPTATSAGSCTIVDLSPTTGFGPRRIAHIRTGLSIGTHRLRVKVLSGAAELDAFLVIR